MGVRMAALAPHPPIIIPEIGGRERDRVKKTITSMTRLAEDIKNVDPDILITISPHGPVFSDAISIIYQEELTGDFSEFGAPEVNFKIDINLELIDRLKKNADKEGIDVFTLNKQSLQNYSISPRLDHGVMVPLYFIQEAGVNKPVLPLTMGLLEYETLYKFGYIINRTLDEMDLKAVIVASGDLSHRLKPGAPAGYSPVGRKFDQKLIELLEKKSYRKILKLDKGLIEKAGECGLRPLIIMLGAIQNLELDVDIMSYEGPFGVGYAVVEFYQMEG
ncbi:AmmeMemoRadiSam system protein B [Halothermothrix orenii]|uniref:Extradiol ring-cleavage dioxygenase class III protein subunit B n=1 Tax=Halothermothrix orenii (strain H 168 / OCM 544 / DSM 9562) TaxID=373903 RepID=B8D0U5_HALOH|nr:AmmeMemoRadiSam system protein B [Halothermothrix orenii]ACL68914.1 Extradiol ring-cleavage dioxygenase class III protein subunit B [Halothermothrix orenii H 168]ACL69009.1 Extradiol ring-cleavage dioxygenase class III protein subunit B [Halothermothrix orenii H 168]